MNRVEKQLEAHRDELARCFASLLESVEASRVQVKARVDELGHRVEEQLEAQREHGVPEHTKEGSARDSENSSEESSARDPEEAAQKDSGNDIRSWC